MTDLRDDIHEQLQGLLTPEMLEKLLNNVFEQKKRARGWCPNCKKQVWVDIEDSKAVVSAMGELLNQTMGRPKEAAVTDNEKIHFERVVYLGDDAPV